MLDANGIEYMTLPGRPETTQLIADATMERLALLTGAGATM